MAVPVKLSVFKGKIIAIDGPAGSGKSTTARQLALRLGYTYLDTGAMYRAVALFALRHEVSLDDENALTQIASRITIEFKSDSEKGQLIFLNDEDVSDAIRTEEVTHGSSAVAVFAGVRTEMVGRQKLLGAKGNIVAEGRDTTSVVFPRADLKVYLQADIKVRAQRRHMEAALRGQESNIEMQEKLLAERDENDSGRKESPLMKVPDAVVIDTTRMSIDQQVEAIIDTARRMFTVKR